MTKTVKIIFKERSRKGNERRKGLLIIHSDANMAQFERIREGITDFMNSDREIAIMNLPLSARTQFIRL